MILYGNIPHSGRSQSSTPSRVRCSGDPWFRMAGCDLVANNLRCGAREDEDILTTSGLRMSQTRTPCVHLTGGCHGSRHPAYLPTSVIPETCVAGCPRTRCLATGDFASDCGQVLRSHVAAGPGGMSESRGLPPYNILLGCARRML